MTSKGNSTYRVILSKEAINYLKRLDREVQSRIIKRLEALALDPFVGDVKSLKELEGRWRCRVGSFRIIFTIEKDNRLIKVSAIRPRGQAYKKK